MIRLLLLHCNAGQACSSSSYATIGGILWRVLFFTKTNNSNNNNNNNNKKTATVTAPATLRQLLNGYFTTGNISEARCLIKAVLYLKKKM